MRTSELTGFSMEHLIEFFKKLKSIFDDLGIVPTPEATLGGGSAAPAFYFA